MGLYADLTTVRKACIWVVSAITSLLALGFAYHKYEQHNADMPELETAEEGIRKDLMQYSKEASRERQAILQTQNIMNRKMINDDIMDKIRFWKQEKRAIEFEYQDKPITFEVRLRIDEIESEIKKLELLLQRNG